MRVRVQKIELKTPLAWEPKTQGGVARVTRTLRRVQNARCGACTTPRVRWHKELLPSAKTWLSEGTRGGGS